MGKVHLQNCLKLDSAELSAVSDLSERALGSAKKLGVRKTFRDYQKMLKNGDVDAVIIALPTHLHMECIRAVAEAGKNILVEKPLARNVQEGKEILSLTRKNGVKLMVGYHLRFCEPFLALRKRMQIGMLGDVETAHATNIGPGPFMHRADGYSPRPVPTWWFQKELIGGGALMDSGSHLMNLLRWYFGEVADVRSLLDHKFNMDTEDQALCFIKFKSGTKAILNASWLSQKSQTKIEIFGTFDHDCAEHIPPSKFVTFLQLLTRQTPRFYLPYLSEITHFVHCVENDIQPSPSCIDALKDLEAISLAYENSIIM